MSKLGIVSKTIHEVEIVARVLTTVVEDSEALNTVSDKHGLEGIQLVRGTLPLANFEPSGNDDVFGIEVRETKGFANIISSSVFNRSICGASVID